MPVGFLSRRQTVFLIPGSRARPSRAFANGGAAVAVTPSNPPSTSSTTLVMMGFGSSCKITPIYTGRIAVGFSYGGSNSSGQSGGAQYGIQYGTGSPPAFGTAVTGTQIGSRPTVTSLAGNTFPVAQNGIIISLSRRTTYWFDVVLSINNAAANIQANSPMFFAFEF